MSKGLLKVNGRGASSSTIPPKSGTRQIEFNNTTWVGKACKRIEYTIGKSKRNEKDKSAALSHHLPGSPKTR